VKEEAAGQQAIKAPIGKERTRTQWEQKTPKQNKKPYPDNNMTPAYAVVFVKYQIIGNN